VIKPIKPAAHGVIDYGFVALNTLAPTLFGLTGSARTLCYLFAGAQGVLNALTDHPPGIRKLVPLRVHGQLETPYVPTLLAQPRTGRYFLSLFAIAASNFLLSDYMAYERPQSVPNPGTFERSSIPLPSK
jgi:hypothetical protein